MKESTRFKLAIGLFVGYFFEGIVTMIWPSFPLAIVVGAQGFVGVYYFTVKTVDNIKTTKYTAPCPPVVEPPK